MTFTPTAEQAAILKAFTEGSDLVVQAGAGTGKTTTLKLLAKSTERLGTYIAFNRSIADEAAQTMPATVRCKTAHGLAWQEFGKQFSSRMNAERQGWGPTLEFLNATSLTVRAYDGSRRNLSAYQMARQVLDTVKAFCQTSDPELTPAHVPVIRGLDQPSMTGRQVAGENHDRIVDYVMPRARKAWKDIQQTEGVLAYDHSYYLKGWALTKPKLRGDFLMFDEAQDANGVIAGVVNDQTHLQRVFVGDDSQSIMGFAGAKNAMRSFARRDGVVTLALTESFRFGPVVAGAANVLLDLLNAPLRITGTERIESRITHLDAGGVAADAVLCRTNAGALDEVINLQRAGRRVCLLGNADELRRFVEGAKELQTKGSTNYFQLMAFDSWAQVQEFVELDPSGVELATMVELVDNYSAPTLLDALNKCVREHAAQVVVSTAHKAKGREWESVRISADFVLPDEDVAPEFVKAELMLAYVALTRAKVNLDPGMLGSWVNQGAAQAAAKQAATSVANPAAEAVSLVGVPESPVSLAGPQNGTESVSGGYAALVAAPVGSPRSIEVTGATWDRLVLVAQSSGCEPEELAARLLDGVLAGLLPALPSPVAVA